MTLEPSTKLPLFDNNNATSSTGGIITPTNESSSIYRKRPYLGYVELVESWLTGGAQVVTITLVGLLLCCATCLKHKMRTSNGLSPTMYVYLAAHLLGSSLSLPRNVYLIGRWSASGRDYSPHPLYWAGMVEVIYVTSSSIPVFFVTLERCFAMKVTLMQKNPSLPCWLAALSAGTLCVVVATQLSIAANELPLHPKTAFCRSAPCFMVKSRAFSLSTTKGTFASMNLILSVYFFYLLGKLGSEQAKQLRNRLVKYLMVFEIVFGIIPYFFAIGFNLIVGEVSANYFGTYAIMLACLDAAACSVYYSFRLLSWGTAVAPVTTVH